MATEEESPQFEHDCKNCIFLGRYEAHPNPPCDLYVCPPSDIVVARYGNDGSEYSSGLVFAGEGGHPWLVEATKRARQRGLPPKPGEQPEPPKAVEVAARVTSPDLPVAERFARDFIKGGAFAQSDMVFVNHPDIGSQLILDVRASGTLSMEKYGLSAAQVLDVQEAIGRFVAEAINEKLAKEGIKP